MVSRLRLVVFLYLRFFLFSGVAVFYVLRFGELLIKWILIEPTLCVFFWSSRLNPIMTLSRTRVAVYINFGMWLLSVTGGLVFCTCGLVFAPHPSETPAAPKVWTVVGSAHSRWGLCLTTPFWLPIPFDRTALPVSLKRLLFKMGVPWAWGVLLFSSNIAITHNFPHCFAVALPQSKD